MKLGKADSLGRGKGFLLFFTFLGSEGRKRGVCNCPFGVGDGKMYNCYGSHLGAEDSPFPVPNLDYLNSLILKDNCRKQCPAW